MSDIFAVKNKKVIIAVFLLIMISTILFTSMKTELNLFDALFKGLVVFLWGYAFSYVMAMFRSWGRKKFKKEGPDYFREIILYLCSILTIIFFVLSLYSGLTGEFSQRYMVQTFFVSGVVLGFYWAKVKEVE